MNKSESIIELAKALAAFQGEVKQPTKDGKNPHFKSTYVTLDGVVAAITETASKHGLSFMQFPINNENRIGVKTLVMHTSGEFIETEPIFAQPMKQDAQAAGSVITYLKRYSLAAIFGITSDVDDDGNGATFGGNQQQQQYQQPPQYQQQYQQQAPPQYQQHTQQQQYQQAPTTGDGITPNQIKALGASLSDAAKRAKMDREAVAEYARLQCNIPTEISSKELTKRQASQLIDFLKNMPDAQ